MADEFQAWLGRVQTSEDMIDVGRANTLLTTLARPEQLTAGDALPGLFHWIYFWTVRPPDVDHVLRRLHPPKPCLEFVGHPFSPYRLASIEIFIGAN